MADDIDAKVWVGRSLFAATLMVIFFTQLLPLDMLPRAWPWPDFLLLVTLVWVARRPDLAPMIVIAIIFLVADLMLQRPPGLWAALVFILSETIRKRAPAIRNMPISLEWGTVTIGIIAITLINRLVLGLVFIPRDPLGLTLIQLGMTIAFYPLVVLLAHLIFGVSRPAPGQVNSLGHRL